MGTYDLDLLGLHEPPPSRSKMEGQSPYTADGEGAVVGGSYHASNPFGGDLPYLALYVDTAWSLQTSKRGERDMSQT